MATAAMAMLNRRVIDDARRTVTAPPTDRSWDLRHFRIVHPDGFYIRATGTRVTYH